VVVVGAGDVADITDKVAVDFVVVPIGDVVAVSVVVIVAAVSFASLSVVGWGAAVPSIVVVRFEGVIVARICVVVVWLDVVVGSIVALASNGADDIVSDG